MTADCGCLELGPRHPDVIRERDVGCDETDGRFADVDVTRCARVPPTMVEVSRRIRGLLPLRPLGRGDDRRRAAATMTPQAAPEFIHASGTCSEDLIAGTLASAVKGRRHWGLSGGTAPRKWFTRFGGWPRSSHSEAVVCRPMATTWYVAHGRLFEGETIQSFSNEDDAKSAAYGYLARRVRARIRLSRDREDVSENER
jgi:hypothetical protein